MLTLLCSEDEEPWDISVEEWGASMALPWSSEPEYRLLRRTFALSESSSSHGIPATFQPKLKPFGDSDLKIFRSRAMLPGHDWHSLYTGVRGEIALDVPTLRRLSGSLPHPSTGLYRT